MTPEAFATQLDRLNTALTTGDDTEAQAAIYAMDWVAPGTAERMWNSLARAARKHGVATERDLRGASLVQVDGFIGCGESMPLLLADDHPDDFAPPHTCGK